MQHIGHTIGSSHHEDCLCATRQLICQKSTTFWRPRGNAYQPFKASPHGNTTGGPPEVLLVMMSLSRFQRGLLPLLSCPMRTLLGTPTSATSSKNVSVRPLLIATVQLNCGGESSEPSLRSEHQLVDQDRRRCHNIHRSSGLHVGNWMWKVTSTTDSTPAETFAGALSKALGTNTDFIRAIYGT